MRVLALIACSLISILQWQIAAGLGCLPSCVNGVCRQGFNTAEPYCDCSGTGYTGITCSMSAAAPGPAPVSSGAANTACRPSCVHGVCRQGFNTAESYCDCTGTSYSGIACNITGAGTAGQIYVAAAAPQAPSAAAPAPAPASGPTAAPLQLPVSASSVPAATAADTNAFIPVPDKFPGWAIALVAVVSGCILVGTAVGAAVCSRRNRATFVRYQDHHPGPPTVQLSS